MWLAIANPLTTNKTCCFPNIAEVRCLKLIINQNDSLQETEIIINCAVLDRRIRNLADFIGQYSTSLEGIVDGVSYYIHWI